MRILSILVFLFTYIGFCLAAEPKQSRPLNKKDWANLDQSVTTSSAIDDLIEHELKIHNKKKTTLCSDSDFYRRVALDLTGKLPAQDNLEAFLKDKAGDKRKKLINKLLESSDFNKYWGQYWSEVIATKVSDKRGLRAYEPFQKWMTGQIKKNTPWDKVAYELITAVGKVLPSDKQGEYIGKGQTFLMLAHLGPDAPIERASEVSRIFLGIQIQCAQCHDHKSDVWKRRQFHEFAAYFARTKDEVAFSPDKNKGFGFRIFSDEKNEYMMPSLEDPSKSTLIHPKFLDGKAGPKNATDKDRRKSVANAITSKNNPWFAAAYVNRIWGKLLGQGFCQPIDDIGPNKDFVQHKAFLRLVGAFQGMNYNNQEFLRLVLNTEAYQRNILIGETQYEHLLFAGSYPSRLDGYAFLGSLNSALGLADPSGPLLFAGNYKKQFQNEFNFDPSLPPDEVESSVAQALWMMNNSKLNQNLQSKLASFLENLLKKYPDDSQAFRALYTKVLCRLPVAFEEAKFKEYLAKTKKRNDAYEDILWALINTTEFQSRR